jgi:pleiotropic regulator 1
MFYLIKAPVQPGSMDSEAGVFAMAFDNSGTRLITAEADKTIKLYREDDTAVSILLGVLWINDILLVLLYFKYH